MRNKEKQENWAMNYQEALDNDIIESGDVIAFPGASWKEKFIERVKEEPYYAVGIAYVQNKNSQFMFHSLPFKGVIQSDLKSNKPFHVIKTGINWNKKVYDEVRMTYGEGYGYIETILAPFNLNKSNRKLTNATYVVSVLNEASYRLNYLGCTPTLLVQDLIDLGRKVIEIE